jgi:hypothetical protein
MTNTRHCRDRIPLSAAGLSSPPFPQTPLFLLCRPPVPGGARGSGSVSPAGDFRPKCARPSWRLTSSPCRHETSSFHLFRATSSSPSEGTLCAEQKQRRRRPGPAALEPMKHHIVSITLFLFLGLCGASVAPEKGPVLPADWFRRFLPLISPSLLTRARRCLGAMSQWGQSQSRQASACVARCARDRRANLARDLSGARSTVLRASAA